MLRSHEAVLNDPEPMVLVDALGAATVNLKAHFWIDGRTYSVDRVRSAALRLIKRALVEHGISMPDEAREVIFPQGVPIVREAPAVAAPAAATRPAPRQPEREEAATSAEGGLGNEAAELTGEVADATIPEAASENLLNR